MDKNDSQTSTSPIPKSEVRRSFALGVFNGAAFQLAESLIDPPLVLTWFVNQLTTSNLLVGMVAPLGDAGWFLPQIFISARVQRMRYKKPSYTLAAVIRVLAWILLTVTVWFVDDPTLLLISFFSTYLLARLAGGLGGLGFFDVMAKTIPARRRGSFFAWRQFLGGILGLGGGLLVKGILNHPSFPFPRDHALLFGLYCAVMTPALLAFIVVREPPGAFVKERVTVREQFRRAGQILRENLAYRRHLGARMTLALAGIALPFYGIYARNVLGAPESMVGLYISGRIGAQLLLNLPWGRLSDRYGNRLVMRLLTLGNGITVLLALALISLVGLFNLQGAWLPYLALLLFILDGAVRPAQVLSGSNFLLELVPEDERPLYLGLSNTLMGIVTLISGLGGLLVDTLGFSGLFLVSLILCLIAYVLASSLPEPRGR